VAEDPKVEVEVVVGGATLAMTHYHDRSNGPSIVIDCRVE